MRVDRDHHLGGYVDHGDQGGVLWRLRGMGSDELQLPPTLHLQSYSSIDFHGGRGRHGCLHSFPRLRGLTWRATLHGATSFLPSGQSSQSEPGPRPPLPRSYGGRGFGPCHSLPLSLSFARARVRGFPPSPRARAPPLSLSLSTGLGGRLSLSLFFNTARGASLALCPPLSLSLLRA